MSRKPSLKDAIAATDQLDLSNDSSFGDAGSQSGRQGEARRGVLVRVNADVRRKLRLVAISRDTTVQDLLLAAIASILEEPNPAPKP
jgi:hypothetical protein